jgi:hypothetical protein
VADVEIQKEISMTRSAMTSAIAALAILTLPAVSYAQSGAGGGSAGGAAGGSTAINGGAPGTNSAGTAQSSGPGANTGAGVTTGAAGTGTMARPQADVDAAIHEENKTIDRRLRSICRGC